MSRESERREREAAIREIMDRIAAAHPDGVFKAADAPSKADRPTRRAEPKKAASPAPPSGKKPDADVDPYVRARGIVLRQLTMAPKSRHQLREKLRQRDCPDEVAEEVLDRMTEVGLVDDEKYAEALVRSQQASRGLSKRGLEHELRTKGVDREIADDVLAQVSSLQEEDRARRLVDARLPRLRGLHRDVAMRRLAGLLGRKGYPASLSLRVIREAIDADPAFRRD